MRRDFRGAGRWRGGLGQIREYEILDGPLTFSHRGDATPRRPRASRAAGCYPLTLPARCRRAARRLARLGRA